MNRFFQTIPARLTILTLLMSSSAFAQVEKAPPSACSITGILSKLGETLTQCDQRFERYQYFVAFNGFADDNHFDFLFSGGDCPGQDTSESGTESERVLYVDACSEQYYTDNGDAFAGIIKFVIACEECVDRENRSPN